MRENAMKQLLSSMFIILTGTFFCDTVPPAQAEPTHSLKTLAAMPWAEYTVARDRLLSQHPEAWNVSVETSHSWQEGLVAFILNQRLAFPAKFNKWDQLQPEHSIRGFLYDLSGEPFKGERQASFAFLIEKTWKAATDAEREAAFDTINPTPQVTEEVLLWIKIWEDSDFEQLRKIALVEVCADAAPATQPVILEALSNPADVPAVFRCLTGLGYRDGERTVEALLKHRDTIWANPSWAQLAMWALARNSSPRARPLVYEYVMDPQNSEFERTRALASCTGNPNPEDADVAIRLLTDLKSMDKKEEVLRTLGTWPIELGSPILRGVLRSSTEDSLVKSAAFALADAHKKAQDVGSRAALEDIALLQSLTERDFISPTTRVHLGMNIERIRGNRAELPDKAPEK